MGTHKVTQNFHRLRDRDGAYGVQQLYATALFKEGQSISFLGVPMIQFSALELLAAYAISFLFGAATACGLRIYTDHLRTKTA